MSLLRWIKDNQLIRGFYFAWKRNFGDIRHKHFGFFGKNVIISPPFSGNSFNIYIGDYVGIGPHAQLSTPNAKIVFKGNTAVAEHLTIHTGNHVRVVGRYISDIADIDKPQG